MESKIKWQTGAPKEYGSYMVTWKNKNTTGVSIAFFDSDLWDSFDYGDCYIVAWCPLYEIEPYKE